MNAEKPDAPDNKRTFIGITDGTSNTIMLGHGNINTTQYQAAADVTLSSNIFGGGSSHVETPKLVGLYKSGQLKIDEMVTTTYSLENINDGYQDMLEGKNIRGVIKFSEADW